MSRVTTLLSVFRPALLLVLGATLAAGIAPVLGARPPAQPAVTVRTRSVSCNGLNFSPVDSATGFDYQGSELFRSGGLSGSGFFLCDPGLPNGAIVKKVQFTLLDSDDGEVRYCGLYRHGLKPATATAIQTMAHVPSSDTVNAGGVMRLSTNSISHATIDNATDSYWLQCQLTDDSYHLGIYGADVIYTISSANG